MPWCCAAKVYKELFRSSIDVVVVDPAGGEWLCVVQTEARNDMRPQYTLRVRPGVPDAAFATPWKGISC